MRLPSGLRDAVYLTAARWGCLSTVHSTGYRAGIVRILLAGTVGRF